MKKSHFRSIGLSLLMTIMGLTFIQSVFAVEAIAKSKCVGSCEDDKLNFEIF